MKKYEKEVEQAHLNNEKAVLKKLESNYKDALDEINSRIQILMARQDADLQHVIYQVEYQKALKTQIQTILETLQNNEFETVSEYLTKSYEEGFQGALYALQKQGVPLLFPIDQRQVVEAVQLETKLSESLYTAMGKDIKELQRKIAGEISRGISNATMYGDISRNIASYAAIPKNRAMTIARTESHRIQESAAAKAQEQSKKKGADIVKVWDSALDGRTRETHRKLNGQIRELEDLFEVDGKKAKRPGEFGRPEEDINCRCRSRSTARWLLDADETKMLGNTDKMTDDDLKPIAKKLHISTDELRTFSGQIIPVKAKDYADFKRQYEKIWNYEGTDFQKEVEKRIASYGE